MAETDVVRLVFRLEAEQTIGPGDQRIGISTGDLVALSRLCDEAAGRVAERAAWRCMASLEVPEKERLEILARGPFFQRERPFAVGQVETVQDGSLLFVIGVGATVIGSWLVKELLGGTVRAAWEESAVGEKLRHALRDGLFGGAASAVEAAVAEPLLPGQLAVESVAADSASEGTAPTEIRVDVRKVWNPELDALRDYESVIGAPAPRSRHHTI
jgi:hypothetical protein